MCHERQKSHLETGETLYREKYRIHSYSSNSVEKEDFEVAAQLQESLDKINIEIEEMNITDSMLTTCNQKVTLETQYKYILLSGTK